jgi:hypothetical protein
MKILPNLNAVPAELKSRDQWLVWRFEPGEPKPRKVPYSPSTGHRASSTDPATWSSLDLALSAAAAGEYEGIGFVVTSADDIVGVDLDDCMDAAGNIHHEARALVDRLSSYTEITPSQKGLRIYVRGVKTTDRCKRSNVQGCAAIEIYGDARYFTFTGQHLEGTPINVQPRQAELNKLCAELWPAAPDRPSRSAPSGEGFSGDDRGLLDIAFQAKNGEKLKRLFEGDDADYASRSEADLALCGAIAFYTGPDPDRIERIVRGSGLRREKWDRLDYLARTIAKALEGRTEFYSPGGLHITNDWLEKNGLAFPTGSAGAVTTTAEFPMDENDPNTSAAPSPDRVPILVAPDEGRVTDEVIEAVSRDPDIYRRGTRLVRVIRNGRSAGCDAGELVITDLPTASLREKSTRYISFLKKTRDGLKAVHPPDWCVKQADARGHWPAIRELVGISDVPVLRPDGTVHQTPGYDPQTGVLYEPVGTYLPIPEVVGDEDILDATRDLFDIVCDFKFVAPCHRSAFFAALLTVVGRYAFEGPAPMFVFDANVRGAGKTLLALVAASIALGRTVATSGYVESDDEMRKQITSKLLEGQRLVILDNLPGSVGCPSLDRVLTTTVWEDRILGKSASATLPAKAVWFATGNNVVLMADTSRRVVPIRVEVLDENPEERSGFKYPDLLRHVRANRAKLLRASIVWLSGYIRAGRPTMGLQPFGSFEGWSDTIRSAVAWAAPPDPCEGRAQLAEDSDRAKDELVGVLHGLRIYDPGDSGIVVADLLRNLYQKDAPRDDDQSRLRAALEAAVGSRPGQAPTARQVGNYFRAHRRRVASGMHLDNDSSEKRARGTVWRVRGSEVPPV